MTFVDRATFIHPDGTCEETVERTRLRVFSPDGTPSLFVWDADAVPEWVADGAEVVAAHEDGTVTASFTVSGVSTAPPLAERVEFVDTGAAAIVTSRRAVRSP